MFDFPVGLATSWHAPSELDITPHMRAWLLDTDSLTAKIKQHCSDFQVAVLGHAPQALTDNERAVLATADYDVREVMLYADHQPWVFARSCLPQAMAELNFGQLGNQSLGQALFTDQRFERQAFQLCRLPVSHPIAQAAKAEHALYGRRSLFHFAKQHLLVAEVFLPASPIYRELQHA